MLRQQNDADSGQDFHEKRILANSMSIIANMFVMDHFHLQTERIRRQLLIVALD